MQKIYWLNVFSDQKGEKGTLQRRVGVSFIIWPQRTTQKMMNISQIEGHHEKKYTRKEVWASLAFLETKRTVKNISRWILGLVIYSPDKHYKELDLNSPFNKIILIFEQEMRSPKLCLNEKILDNCELKNIFIFLLFAIGM